MEVGVLLRSTIAFVVLICGALAIPIPECCSHVTGVCRSSCEQISLVSIAVDSQEKELHLKNLTQFCPKDLFAFWHCLNGSLQAIAEGEGWFGRTCCKLPQSRSCRLACLKAKSKQDVYQSCRQSDESNFFNCVYHQEDAERCCSNSKTQECHEACKKIFFLQRSPNRKLRSAVVLSCAYHSPKVLRCVKEHIKTAPDAKRIHKENLPPNPADLLCCDLSPDLNCRNTCKAALHLKTTEQEIVDVIESDCGAPMELPEDQLWQCLLKNAQPIKSANASISRTNRIGVDSAKLQCCFKAVSSSCRKLCFQTFDNDWFNSWEAFEKKCASGSAESRMLQCLTEVDEPCKLGCEGLSYCTNFNGRSTELFQNCNAAADNAARKELEKWQKHSYIGILMMRIHVRDIMTCHPEVWKAIACILQVKPCHQSYHAAKICRSDCVDILTKCMDYKNLPPGVTPESVCENLSPHVSEENCVTVASFLDRSPTATEAHQITHPCDANNCNVSDVCIVNRDCTRGQKCLPYKCQPGCKMGDSSQVIVPYGTYVRIPVNSAGSPCYKICRCSERLIIEDCLVMSCLQTVNCWRNNQKIVHGNVFDIGCNKCLCYSGVITCSKFTCADAAERNSISFTGLPCNCAPHYVPYCGADGKTYPSACIAGCMGLNEKQMEFGPCSAHDPCHGKSCPFNQRCVPKKSVCLSISQQICEQSECVEKNSECSLESKEFICSTNNEQFDNFCWLLKSNSTFSYRGKCKRFCDNENIVCGQNGETYNNECAALADLVKVDYEGPCMTVGTMIDNNHSPCGIGFKCPPLIPSNCVRVTPPGTCCPMCGGGLQILFAKQQIDYTLENLEDMEQLTVQMVVESLQRHIQTAECDLFAYLGIHNVLVVLVAPVSKRPTSLQVKVCAAEAKKIVFLIQHRNPVLLADVILSHLVTAEILPTYNKASSENFSRTFLFVVCSCYLLVFKYFYT